MASSKEIFTGKDDGPTIEEFIKELKSRYGRYWRVWFNLKDEATKWWVSLDRKQLTKLSDAEFEKVLLDKWARARKKENETHKGLIQKEKIVVSINPSCKHNFINVNLAKKLQVRAKHIENTQVDDDDV